MEIGALTPSKYGSFLGNAFTIDSSLQIGQSLKLILLNVTLHWRHSAQARPNSTDLITLTT